jgi:PhnB protein
MTNYRPEGYSTVTPMVVVTDAAAAIEFYAAVFGARVVSRMNGPAGQVWHCELQFEAGRLQLMDANEQFRMVALDPSIDDVPYSLAIYVQDCDAVTAKAAELGATVREPAGDFEVTGDRFSSIRDPFGVRWTVMTRKVDKADADVQAGLDDWVESMEAAGEP